MTSLQDLREAVTELVVAAIGLPDEAMDLPYAWGEYDEDGLRFALLTAYHQLRDLGFAIEETRQPPTHAQRILGGFVRTHADIDGLLAGAADGELDREPAPGQWPLREVVRHMLDSDRGFAGAIRLTLRTVAEGEQPRPLQREDWASFADKSSPEGGVSAVRGELRRSLETALHDFGGLTDRELEVRSYFWEDTPFPLRFRLVRFELHWRQHVIQADKTMMGIGHPPREAERLCRLVHAGLGDVEAALLGVPDGFMEGRTREVEAAMREHAESVRTTAAG